MKRLVIVVVVLLSVAVVGFVLTRSGDDASNDPAVDSAPGADPVIPGTVPDLPSPKEAAANAVALTGDVVAAGLISRRELIESFTTPGFGGQLADLTSEQITSMQLALAGSGRGDAEMSVAEFPLRTRTIASDDTAATVEVWSMMVIAVADEPVARQAWRTVTLELALVDGRWLVNGWASAEGPTPAGSAEGVIAPGHEVAERLQWSEVE